MKYLRLLARPLTLSSAPRILTAAATFRHPLLLHQQCPALQILPSPVCLSRNQLFATVMDSRVRRITDQLEQPDLDDRSYRVIELPNKLEALLVHDPQTDKASASLSVNVGNFSDDDDMPGMAHAVEHLLFMGTEKYPVENEYSSYLSSHSGHSNAYTAATQTNYFFECAATSESSAATTNGVNGVNGHSNITIRGPFYGALDRFAQFFVKPLFLESTLDRELRAVDSENKKNLQSDNWRLSQLQKSLSNPQHPYHHFSTGNLATLRDEPEKRGVKIRDEFIKFYEKHYSANRMKLVVLGQESLDELEEWVVELFSEIQNKDLPQNRWDGVDAVAKDQLVTEIFAKPVMESRSLEINFPYQDEDEMYETLPSRYISHLIGHEGPGSILSYLKEEGLANSLSCGAHTVCPGSAFLEIDIGLTPEGLKKYREIVKVVFQYIGMMKEKPPVDWMFEEMKNMAEVDFRFQQKAPASRFASGTSSIMQKPLPREWLLSGTSKFRRFDPDAIINAMQFLREDNFRLMIVSQDYPGDWNQKEKWYGTEHRVDKIPDQVITEIREALSSNATIRPKALHLPNKNEFIPTKLDVEKTEVTEPAKTPKLLRDDERVRLWWKKDDTFWVPKANVNVLLRSPLTYASPANYVKSVLYINLVKDSLQEYSYDADISGLSYDLAAHILGLELDVHGYNDKLNVLLEKILVSLRDLEIRQDRFDIIKERFARKYKNWGFQQPYYQVGDFSRYLIDEKRYITPNYASELPHVTIDDLKAFAKELLSQTHIEILAHGNLYREEAKKIGLLVESTLKTRPLPPSQWALRRSVLLPPGSNFVYNHILADPENVNHAIEYYLHVGNVVDVKLRARLQLVAQITDEPAFDQLRTKEQLGYVVWSGVRPGANTMGYRVLIQSERDPEYLESRIDAFLLKSKTYLEEMSDDDFEKHKRSLISKRLEKLKNLNLETNRLWNYIVAEYYNFFQVDTDVAEIRRVSKQDLQDFYASYIDPESPKRAKMAIHLTAQKKAPLAETPSPEQKAQLIEVFQQLLSAMSVDVSLPGLTKALANVEANDQAAIIAALKPYLGSASQEARAQEAVAQLENAIPQAFLALNIKTSTEAPNGSEVSAKISKPIVIDDVHRWKAGLQVSQGTSPLVDIKDFQDFDSKL